MNKPRAIMKKKFSLADPSDNKNLKRKRDQPKALKEAPNQKTYKKQYNPVEEARLERIVFGDPSDIINTLLGDDNEISEKEESVKTSTSILESSDDSHDDVSDDEEAENSGKKKIAWEDEDDIAYSHRKAVRAQHKKIIHFENPRRAYSEVLQTRYKELVGTPKWAELNKAEQDADDLDNDILKHSCHVEKPKLKKLPKGTIEIKALTPLNKTTHAEGPIVSGVEFHPSSTVALVAGSSGILSIFQVDGIENTKLHSMQYKKFPISSAKFLKEGTEVLCGSKFYAHCHSYDLMAGKTCRIPLPHGITNMEQFEISPDGKLLAICGRRGEIYLLTSSSKELVGTLQMNARCRSLAFTTDGSKLISHGESNEMYIWDVKNRVCVHRAIDDGCMFATCLAVSSSGQFLATGSKEGVVNLYDTKHVLEQKNPVPLKIVLNLVTSITALKFNPLTEILAIASNKKPNAFKMLHLPSFNIFSNFPTFETNIVMPETIAFSPGSGYLSISNRTGTAFLYRLKHYRNY